LLRRDCGICIVLLVSGRMRNLLVFVSVLESVMLRYVVDCVLESVYHEQAGLDLSCETKYMKYQEKQISKASSKLKRKQNEYVK